MPDNITLRDIARESGVSLATVSRALRDDPITAEATREKVQAFAKKLGYRPDPAMQVLIERRWHGRRTNEGMNIAFIFDGRGSNAEVSRGWYQRFRESADALGYILIAEDLRDYPNAQKLIKRMEAKGVTAVVLSLISEIPYEIDAINHRFAAISVNVSTWQPECPVIMHDEFQAIEKVWHRLNEMGYKRIGVLLQDYPESFSMDQRLGAIYCRHHNVRPVANRVPFHLHDKNSGPDNPGIQKWIKRYKPDVILGDDHEEMDLLKSMGYRIPEDFAFATINLWNKELTGEIAGYFRDNVILFERGLKLLNMMVRTGSNGSAQGDLIEMVKGKWIDGTSLPGKSASKNNTA
ncbi:LacI family DNA-binding transcriptional regulator [Rubellicoccus peritrichatus]|uniref:LacI family DNA-binding transcriptional regulator n=1 Tax=Rubellicoccus peritrichatus TaxID=3080537 RepID=A0AAQ3LB35_9BACT|nr:LacI family DNA-binding transcriptional regulator [Puniceicoccus sp. CR14]WOO41017.1 LacI family DNA-binding transcriptional regulator [Puniceicoccus sp. CR14]